MIDVFDWATLGKFALAIVTLASFALKLAADFFKSRAARSLVLQAEKDAFHVSPEDLEADTEKLKHSSETLDQRANDINDLIKKNRDLLQAGRLFDLYNKQIEKYQTETQARAGWSFMFAIISMVAGLGFIVLGGIHVLTNPGWEHVAAAATISGIGGAVAAFITKTFLDVHRLSLSQLNHYFRQPVVNAHVLTGQRLADQIDDPSLRQQAYQQLLMQVASLIHEETVPASASSSKQPKRQSAKGRSLSAKTSEE
ncbi:hypothetical protein [Pseudomonas sp. NA-150]|uniref:TRADD-N-associated membrane domain-containing protein n=1 Tax=Pseudomonas sp. NA-150 TaxID=3367525 RepID=UPI0037C8C10C